MFFSHSHIQVAWVHIDRQMIITIHQHIISHIPRYSMSFDNDNTWMLHIRQVQQEDRGVYMCQINSNPWISQVGYLQVVGKLDLRYSRFFGDMIRQKTNLFIKDD